MKMSIASILALVATISLADEGFQIDMPIMETADKLQILTLKKLAVGETGLVSMYGFGMCVDNGVLKVPSISQLDNSPNKYLPEFAVTRQPNDTVTVVFSNKGQTPNSDTVKKAILLAAGASGCEEMNKKNIPLYSVKTFLGATSITGLVSNTNRTIQQDSNDLSNTGGNDITNAGSVWVVSQSKSPIDDSPTVTMLKQADSGDQALILRCKEDSTDAFISTQAFLGRNSTNVIIRYDANDAQKQRFSLSTDNKALFFSPAISSIKKMLDSKKLVVRYDDYSGTPSTVEFSIGALKEKIKPLRAACHW